MAAKRQLPISALFAPVASSSPKKAKVESIDLNSFSSAEFMKSLSTTPRASGKSVKELLQLELDSLHENWLVYLQKELQLPYFLKLKEFLWKEGLRSNQKEDICKSIFPIAADVYSWSRYTPLDTVKVVIVGQDPYHDDGQAHGLCFSVAKGVKIPPSLRNIYKELQAEYPNFVPPTHGNLSSWASGGVLLLNTALTVKAHAAGSHSKQGWETFTAKIIELVNKNGGKDGKGVVFMAWGAWAAKCVEKVNSGKHLILKSAHPSPLSAHRGFLGNGHFKQANDWLETKYGEGEGIEWTRLEIGDSPKRKSVASKSTSAAEETPAS